MNKALVYWVAQGVMVLVMAALAGFTALITMGAVAGVAIGIAPVAHFKLAGGLICPDGSEVSFEEGGEVVTYSGGTPSYGTAVQIYCIDAAGARTVLTVPPYPALRQVIQVFAFPQQLPSLACVLRSKAKSCKMPRQ